MDSTSSPMPFRIFQIVLGTIVAAGFFGIMALVATQSVPADNREVFLMLVSQLTGAFLALISFAFGSSVGSQRKDNQTPTVSPGENR